MEDAISTELARAKIAANEIADRIQVNMQILVAAAEHAQFPDAAALVLKATDDLRAVVTNRVAEVARKLEEQRERIRAEESAKLKREADAAAAAEAAKALALAAQPAPPHAPAPAPAPIAQPVASPRPTAAPSAATVKLGDINARLSPIQITADGLAQLGFNPVGTERAAKLYRESDFPLICSAIQMHVGAVKVGVAA
jgi:acyl-homoserine lactone acylase PvdQ